jgi:hypothetical protein
VRIERLGAEDDVEVRAMLTELALDEQQRYAHPQHTREELARGTSLPRHHFTGENHLLVARDEGGAAIGLCWCVLFDPGTGLEGEVAELYVRPEARGGGAGDRAAPGGHDPLPPPPGHLRLRVDPRRQSGGHGRLPQRRVHPHRAGRAHLAAAARPIMPAHVPHP